ncbi:uncharacterized protein [Paramisgurnus dabryanus]|uniref:uncharacterized protein isoform X2 n=1 Tax=Paramisgurnus dabryanus TaxID=90735 RepID=UPI0031F3714A
MFALFSLICLLVIPGMCSHNWTVKYSHRVKCVVKGSTTRLSSSFTYPYGLNITKIFWTIDPVKDEEPSDLSEVPEYKGRVKNNLNKKQNFNLKLSNITDEDEHMYCIRIITNVKKQKYLGYPGIQLNVTELRVEVPEQVVEGNSAALFCKTTCNLTSKTNFTWYKNKSPLSESFRSNKLILQSVSRDDAGDYSCAVKGDEDLKSPPVTLTVRSSSSAGSNTVLHITAAIAAALICICIVVAIIRIIRKIADTGIRSDRSKQENISVTTTDQISSHLTSYDSKTTNDLMYTSITFQRPSASSGDQNDEDADEVQYVSVSHHKTTQKNNVDAEAHDINRPAISSRSNGGLMEDFSVIYSSINVP